MKILNKVLKERKSVTENEVILIAKALGDCNEKQVVEVIDQLRFADPETIEKRNEKIVSTIKKNIYFLSKTSRNYITTFLIPLKREINNVDLRLLLETRAENELTNRQLSNDLTSLLIKSDVLDFF